MTKTENSAREVDGPANPDRLLANRVFASDGGHAHTKGDAAWLASLRHGSDGPVAHGAWHHANAVAAGHHAGKTVLEDVQPKPVSMRQSESQPSPPTVLLSSHASAVERMPLPQTCTGAT